MPTLSLLSKLTYTEKNSAGFTLIELIIVIVLIGFLATMTTDIITLPVKSYLDLERRTRLVNNAEIALRRMQRDIRRALPNSLRITHTGTALELLHTTDGGRYRAKLAADGSGDVLKFNSADTRFDVLSTLHEPPRGYLAIYNLSSTGANAYAQDNLANISNTSTLNMITLQPAKKFPLQSPQQRFFIVDMPITYRCINGELRRYSDYAISDPTTLPSTFKLQAKASALNCSFSYDAGSATRAGLITLKIELTDKAGESAKLIHQVHVDNMP